MSARRWCSRCRAERPIEWQPEVSFGRGAEVARCPRCGDLWGVRARREPLHTASRPPAANDVDPPSAAEKGCRMGYGVD